MMMMMMMMVVPDEAASSQSPAMIQLGLARINKLLMPVPQRWRAIHVAGTNGKGSICAYLSAMLHAHGITCGRFTSPHLVDRWDCITINQEPVSKALFQYVDAITRARDRDEQIGATEFELLTATAFDIFARERVEYGVVEVGLGGLHDATNALLRKDVSVIAKIGMDHTKHLGGTLEDIAHHKAGIMMQDVPCVVDGTNALTVMQVFAKKAGKRDSELHVVTPQPQFFNMLADQGFEQHQIQNIAVAVRAFHLAVPTAKHQSFSELIPILKAVKWPGRLQVVDTSRIAGAPPRVLLDGAHNPQSASVLATYVKKHLRTGGQPITWVLAVTEEKDASGIVGLLLRRGDRAAVVRFDLVDGMPWVRPTKPSILLEVATKCGVDRKDQFAGHSLAEGLQWASEAAGAGPVVVAGSLYLVSSLFRLLRRSSTSTTSITTTATTSTKIITAPSTVSEQAEATPDGR